MFKNGDRLYMEYTNITTSPVLQNYQRNYLCKDWNSENEILNEHQYGFSINRITTHALMEEITGS